MLGSETTRLRPLPLSPPEPALRVPISVMLVEMVVDRLCYLLRYTIDFKKIRNAGAPYGFGGAEMPQKGTFPGRPDARDFVQRVPAHLGLPACPVRADGEPVRLVPQPLHEIEHRVARLKHERLPPRDVER